MSTPSYGIPGTLGKTYSTESRKKRDAMIKNKRSSINHLGNLIHSAGRIHTQDDEVAEYQVQQDIEGQCGYGETVDPDDPLQYRLDDAVAGDINAQEREQDLCPCRQCRKEEDRHDYYPYADGTCIDPDLLG